MRRFACCSLSLSAAEGWNEGFSSGVTLGSNALNGGSPEERKLSCSILVQFFGESQKLAFLLRFFGGSVWESNPPSTPRRDGSPALKTGRITGPLAPPYIGSRSRHAGSYHGTQLATAGQHSEARCISNPMLMLFGVNREIGNDSSCLQFFAVFRPAAQPVLVRLLSDLVMNLYLHIAICIADVLLFDQ